MSRELNKLSDRKARTAVPPEGKNRHYLSDGGGLYLQLNRNQAGDVSRTLVFRGTLNGKTFEHGLGSLNANSKALAEARKKRDEYRAMLSEGKLPPTAKARKAGVTATGTLSFRAVAELFLAARRSEWVEGGRSEEQWTNTLAAYAYPHIGDKPVNEITLDDIEALLRADGLWETKNVTARRLQNRLEQIFDYAAVKKHCPAGSNPARWKGQLRHVLGKQARGTDKAKHYAGLNWRDIPALVTELAAATDLHTEALLFQIATASRSGEVAGARFDELDLSCKVHPVPVWAPAVERMKGREEHVVPLPPVALLIVQEMRKRHTGPFIFGGDKPIPDRALNWTLQKFRPRMTSHGTARAGFFSWAQATGQQMDLADVQLAHSQGALTAAYQRDALLERRTELMKAWEHHLHGGVTKVDAVRAALNQSAAA